MAPLWPAGKRKTANRELKKSVFCKRCFFGGRGDRLNKIELGASQFRSSSVRPRSGSETASSGNIRSNHQLTDFSLSPDFRLFQYYRPEADAEP
jgi:hypothetical protein